VSGLTGCTPRSENAAKPYSQASRYLTSFIAALPPVASAFDYGCGKLRYLNVMLETSQTLTVVDSEVQLAREQTLLGEPRASVRRMLRGSNRVLVANVAEFARLTEAYDRGYCINVLSVILIEAVRRRAVRLMFSRLRPDGTCLFVVQYRNSDFTRMAAMPNATAWHDGFLVDSLRGYSFYGLIRPDYLKQLVTEAGFEVTDLRLADGSAYLTALRSNGVTPPYSCRLSGTAGVARISQ
jgi:SAM-dependent methyltransferase